MISHYEKTFLHPIASEVNQNTKVSLNQNQKHFSYSFFFLFYIEFTFRILTFQRRVGLIFQKAVGEFFLFQNL